MGKPLLIATIAVWTAVVLLFLYFRWRYSDTPPDESADEPSDKPDPPDKPED